MRLTVCRTLAIAVAAVLVAVTLPAVREFMAVDNCLDAGGAYDYAAHVCKYDVKALPFSAAGWIRMPDLYSMSAALILVVAFAGLFIARNRGSPFSRSAG